MNSTSRAAEEIPTMRQASGPVGAEPGQAPRPAGPAWGLLPFLWALLLALRAGNLPWAYQSSPALLASSLLFAGFLPLLVSFFAAWTFLDRGAPSLLLLSCAALAFGAGSMAGPLALVQGANALVTIQGLMALVSAVCHFASALLSGRPGARLHRPLAWLAGGFLATLGTVGGITFATLGGHTPTCFVPGQGGTPIRNLTLGVAIALFAATAWRLRRRHLASPSAFLDRYGFALALVATGLFGVLLQLNQGSVLSWAGRAIYYAGGVNMLIALALSAKDGHPWAVPLEEALLQSEAQFRELVEFLPDAVILHRDDAFLYVNPAGLKLYGAASLQELQRHKVLDLVAPDSRAFAGARIARIQGETPHTEYREQTLLRLDGTPFPAEIAGQAHWHEGRRCVLTVLRDIGPRKEAEAAARRAEGEAREQAAEAARLHARNEDLERFTRLSVGREYRMIELKKLVNDLSHQLGRPAPYPRHLLEARSALPAREEAHAAPEGSHGA